MQDSAPKDLNELVAHLESRLKEVQETYAITGMANSDMIDKVNNFTSLKKLKKFSILHVGKSRDLHKELSRYSIEAITIALNTIKIVQAKDPRSIKEEEELSSPEE